MSTVRPSVAAGALHPASAGALRAELERLLDEAGARGPARAAARLLLAPHAALARSGPVAAAAHASIERPALVVVLAPNHHGAGAEVALPRQGAFRTPLGVVPIDAGAAGLIAAHLPAARDDWRALARDHSVDMQLPFLQAAAGRAGEAMPRLVVMACAERSLSGLRATGEGLARGLEAAGLSDALLLISADLAADLPAQEVRAADDALLALACDGDIEALFLRARAVPTCATAPLIAGLVAAWRLGCGEARVLARATSAEAGGDPSRAVGYAALRVLPG